MPKIFSTLVLGFAAFGLCVGCFAAEGEDVRQSVQVNPTEFVYNRTTEVWSGKVILKNISAFPLSAIVVSPVQSRGDTQAIDADAYDDKGNAQYKLKLKDGILKPGETVTFPLQLASRNQTALDLQATVTGIPLTPQNTAQITVQVMRTDNEGIIQPAAGAEVMVNGDLRARTDSTGSATLLIAAATSDTDSFDASFASSQAALFVLPRLEVGAKHTVTVTLLDDKEMVGVSLPLKIIELQRLILPRTAQSLSFKFIGELYQVAALTDIEQVMLYDQQGDAIIDLTEKFALSADRTTLICTDVASIRTLLAGKTGRFSFAAYARNIDTVVGYHGVGEFYIAEYTLSGTLAGPPARTGFSLANIPVVAKMGDVVLTTLTGSDGSFTFENLPSGAVHLSAVSYQYEKYFYADASVSLKKDTTLGEVMLNISP